MKYYIVLDPIAYKNASGILAPSNSFNVKEILASFHKQSIAKLFVKKDQAFHYARSLSKKNRQTQSHLLAPIIETDHQIFNAYQQKNIGCIAPLSLDKIKSTWHCEEIRYIEIPIEDIHDDLFSRVSFPTDSLPSIELKNNYSPSCVLL